MTSFQDVSLLDDDPPVNDNTLLKNNPQNSNNNDTNDDNNNNNISIPKNPSSQPQRTIKITGMEERPTRISKYTVYIIECDPPFPGTINVARRFNDFRWLRGILCKQFPGIFVPPLPPTKLLGRFEESFLEERMFDLQRFLYRISINPTFCTCLTFEMFLSRPESTFNEGKKYVEQDMNLEMTQVLKKLQQLYPKINEQDLISTAHKEDIPKLKNFFLKLDEQMKELNNCSNKLLNDMKSLSTDMKNFSLAFTGLYETEKNYPYKPSKVGDRVDLRDQFKEWNSFHHQQAHAYYDHFMRQLRYEHEDVQAFLELFDERESIYKNYSKYENLVVKYTTKQQNNNNTLSPEDEKRKQDAIKSRDLANELYVLITKIMLKSEIVKVWKLKIDTWRQQVFKFSDIQTNVTSKMLMKWKNISE